MAVTYATYVTCVTCATYVTSGSYLDGNAPVCAVEHATDDTRQAVEFFLAGEPHHLHGRKGWEEWCEEEWCEESWCEEWQVDRKLGQQHRREQPHGNQ